ncbi:MAG: FAD-dependent oxidoreductase [Bdellovibrionales bacterium]|nr:FAD-dependent oxidoreductase [Bdellovibrionales bacterium]
MIHEEFDARPLTETRREFVLEQVGKLKRVELLVIGGGIHGATFAHLAALNGLSCLVLEKSDFASGTSSRSSKMLHGGLRYLELLDFRQVYEGVVARDDYIKSASHNAKPLEFLIPVVNGQNWFRRKLGVGLTLYDTIFSRARRRHKWWPGTSHPGIEHIISQQDWSGVFSYYDGVMNDARMVIDTLSAARQEGAVCLNYAKVRAVDYSRDGLVHVHWEDLIDGQTHRISTGMVVNCAGPWVPNIGATKPLVAKESVLYSQGVHLLFNKIWDAPALFLPMDSKARYYFVWPHQHGTLVGTTERELDSVVEDPTPNEGEIEEILQRLNKDLPNAGLNRETLFYAFAGIRTMAASKKKGSSATASRRHSWIYRNGVLSLIGGKFTTARWTVREGLKIVLKLAGLKRSIVDLRGRHLPGSFKLNEVTSEFRRIMFERGVPDRAVEHAISVLGSSVRHFIDPDEAWSHEIIGGEILASVVEWSVLREQAITLEDVMRRRLNLETRPDYGLPLLPGILKELCRLMPNQDWAKQEQNYKDRIQSIKDLLSGNLSQNLRDEGSVSVH